MADPQTQLDGCGSSGCLVRRGKVATAHPGCRCVDDLRGITPEARRVVRALLAERLDLVQAAGQLDTLVGQIGQLGEDPEIAYDGHLWTARVTLQPRDKRCRRVRVSKPASTPQEAAQELRLVERSYRAVWGELPEPEPTCESCGGPAEPGDYCDGDHCPYAEPGNPRSRGGLEA